MSTYLLRCGAVMLLGFMAATPAQADISCSSVTMSPMAFGDVDPQATHTEGVATLSYTCENDGLLTWSAKLCFSIGMPGGGPMDPRKMQDGAANNLNFQLYKDPARTTIWGSQFSGTPTHLIVNITIPGRGVLSTPPVVRTGTATLYGRVLGGQHLSSWLISVCGVC